MSEARGLHKPFQINGLRPSYHLECQSTRRAWRGLEGLSHGTGSRPNLRITIYALDRGAARPVALSREFRAADPARCGAVRGWAVPMKGE